jgi:hypothetical protein
MVEAEYDAELWIGIPELPKDCQGPGFFSKVEDIAVCADFQIGGVFCNHRSFFGLKFDVPKSDPLALLIESYSCTNLPGAGIPHLSTPLDKIVEVRSRLRDINLELDPIHYAHFAEAYIPVAGQSAWEYVIVNDLQIFIAPQHRRFEKTNRLDFVGLSESWDDVVAYLQGTWQQYGGDSWIADGEPWTAAVHCPNSD